MFNRTLSVVLIIAVIAGGYGSWYFYTKYQAVKANPNAEAQKETDKYVSMLSKLIELPKDEVPTIATISDKEKLKGQTFFDVAQNGDILFAYTTAMKAILYRPSTNRIVNVAPISITPNANLTQATKKAVQEPAIRVAYFNGTNTAGLAALTEKSVKDKYPTWQTATSTNATNLTYTGNLIVDVTGQHAKEAGELATLLKGKIGALPAGEVKPDADLLVISGK